MMHDELEKLVSLLSPEKRARMQQIINDRTRYVTLVLEDMYHSLNASATLRTAECFGIQDVHVVEDTAKFQVQQGIAKGASTWLTIHHYKNSASCYEQLKQKGYRIIATTPHADAILLPDILIGRPCALVFGTEDRGLSDVAIQEADVCVKIPMYGFTQSFNVSASVALCLYQVRMKLEHSSFEWRLTSAEREELFYEFAKRLLKVE